MSTQANEKRLAEIRHDYRPYDTFPEFDDGFLDYQKSAHANPYEGKLSEGLKAQAWDRGAEAASRYNRFLSGIEKPKAAAR